MMGWGYQPERIQAGMYMLLYTLFSSFPMLLGMFFVLQEFGGLNFSLFVIIDDYGWFLYVSMIFAFLVKLPLFFFHLWLPSAHVEAPVSGSMILAGVLLKLGGYGMIRVSVLFYQGLMGMFLIMFSMVGGLLIGFNCVRQVDVSVIIAYSSVVHMGLTLGGLLTCYDWGMSGALLMMISHGLCSSGLFFVVNIYYERLGTRSLLVNRGLISMFPFIGFFFFVFCSFNGGAPPSMNLWSEIMLIISVLNYSFVNVYLLFFISFISVCYSLYLYSYLQHGSAYSFLLSFNSGVAGEYLGMVLHVVPLFFMIMNMSYFTIWGC